MKSVRVGLLVGLAVGPIGCGPKSTPMGAKAPVFRAGGDPHALARFAVGTWLQSTDRTSARYDPGALGRMLQDAGENTLELRSDGSALVTVQIGPQSDDEPGRWRVEGGRIVLEFPRTIPRDAQPSRRDHEAWRTKLFEDLVEKFGPLEVAPDGRRLQRGGIVRREDGSTFMGVPVWSRMGKA